MSQKNMGRLAQNMKREIIAIIGRLKDMVNCTKELLLDGKNVEIDDLAIFSVGLHTTGAPLTADERKILADGCLINFYKH